MKMFYVCLMLHIVYYYQVKEERVAYGRKVLFFTKYLGLCAEALFRIIS